MKCLFQWPHFVEFSNLGNLIVFILWFHVHMSIVNCIIFECILLASHDWLESGSQWSAWSSCFVTHDNHLCIFYPLELFHVSLCVWSSTFPVLVCHIYPSVYTQEYIICMNITFWGDGVSPAHSSTSSNLDKYRQECNKLIESLSASRYTQNLSKVILYIVGSLWLPFVSWIFSSII